MNIVPDSPDVFIANFTVVASFFIFAFVVYFVGRS
jgi:hypothetical protein